MKRRLCVDPNPFDHIDEEPTEVRSQLLAVCFATDVRVQQTLNSTPSRFYVASRQFLLVLDVVGPRCLDAVASRPAS